MSTIKKLRKRTKINYNSSADVSRKKLKEEIQLEQETEPVKVKQPIVAPNGKIFYPCQHCYKIFPQKLTSISHMKKCPKKVEISALSETDSTVNNNDVDPTKLQFHKDKDNMENTSPKPSSKINDVSIYDYDENDDNLDDKDLKENSEEALNNRQCKHCNTLFDNPLDLLRHTRDCHNFPRTILPPDEIEKYFDYPNRQFCPICEKPIKTRNFRSVFIKHLLVHTTGLTHECGICKKKFRRRDHMRAHEKRHIVSI